jgi:hypothetical protein
VGALPGRLGLSMLEAVIAAGKPIADISFSPEDPLALDALAREKAVTAVVDCGVSPGLSNFAVGRAAAALASIDGVRILVGGLPADRARPFGYAILFSATDVIEEYTRPARIVEEGRVVTRPALSEVEAVEVPGIGTLEAFLTDGLRTLLATVPARSMVEKTLRYPGHADAMRGLRESGFFEARAIEAGGRSISPRSVTEKLLSVAWKLGEKEEEFTYLRVAVAGRNASGAAKTCTFELLDRPGPGGDVHGPHDGLPLFGRGRDAGARAIPRSGNPTAGAPGERSRGLPAVPGGLAGTGPGLSGDLVGQIGLSGTVAYDSGPLLAIDPRAACALLALDRTYGGVPMKRHIFSFALGLALAVVASAQTGKSLTMSNAPTDQDYRMTIIEPKPGAVIVGKDVNIILGLPSLPQGNKEQSAASDRKEQQMNTPIFQIWVDGKNMGNLPGGTNVFYARDLSYGPHKIVVMAKNTAGGSSIARRSR